MEYTVKKAGNHFIKSKENQSFSIKSIESALCCITRYSEQPLVAINSFTPHTAPQRWNHILHVFLSPWPCIVLESVRELLMKGKLYCEMSWEEGRAVLKLVYLDFSCAQPLGSWVTSGKLFNLSVHWFAQLYIENNSNTFLKRSWGMFLRIHLKGWEQCPAHRKYAK